LSAALDLQASRELGAMDLARREMGSHSPAAHFGLAHVPAEAPPYEPFPTADSVGAAEWGASTRGSGGMPSSVSPTEVGDSAAMMNGASMASQRMPPAATDPIGERRPSPTEAIGRGVTLRGGDCSGFVSACGLVWVSMLSAAPMDGVDGGCDLATSHAQEQTIAALANLDAVLAAAGTSKRRIIEVQLHVSEEQDLDGVQLGWSEWVRSLNGELPAKSVTIAPSASGLAGCRVEVKAIAKAA
jgi:enamine deaminase RidA (YjgF/YER057c/UK114 family)